MSEEPLDLVADLIAGLEGTAVLICLGIFVGAIYLGTRLLDTVWHDTDFLP